MDLAGEAGLAIAGGAFAAGDVVEANAASLLAMADDDYSSGDDLGDSEETQAAKLQAALLGRVAAADDDAARRMRKAEQQDYEQNGAVLDHDEVARRLELLRTFARHLQRVGKNRAGILARLAEPLAEEHWMLSPEYHQRMVDALQGMCGLVGRLPDIAAAAQHCSAAVAALPEGDAAGPDAAGNERHIAQMERLVHEAEQAVEWVQADRTTRASLPTIPS
ncbi:hypothetical protein LPJ61_004370 [Coemansia biformis]|uniref:Uncharacterized protein n=1 Tax=Coemansia biformis TaxID=1286918 RepID=A0A9W7YAD6_9FUNG|nr:hypothetical protein LPJ61_004370 [Coemansia biformis]